MRQGWGLGRQASSQLGFLSVGGPSKCAYRTTSLSEMGPVTARSTTRFQSTTAYSVVRQDTKWCLSFSSIVPLQNRKFWTWANQWTLPRCSLIFKCKFLISLVTQSGTCKFSLCWRQEWTFSCITRTVRKQSHTTSLFVPNMKGRNSYKRDKKQKVVKRTKE